MAAYNQAGYGTGMATNYMPNIGQNYTPYQSMYDAQQAKLQQMQEQYNQQYNPANQQPVQPQQQTLRFECVAVANKEELLARPLAHPEHPILGTNFMNDVIYAKAPDGTIETYRLVDEPEPEAVIIPDGFVSTDAHNEVVNRVNELSAIIIAIKDELDSKSIELDTKINETGTEIAAINEQLSSSEDFESELDRRIAALRDELNGEIENGKKSVRELEQRYESNAAEATAATTDAKPTSNARSNTKANANRSNKAKPRDNAGDEQSEGETKATTRK